MPILKIGFPLLYGILFLWPGYVFFSHSGRVIFSPGTTFVQLNLRLFSLVGLYAFWSVWAQLIIGSNMRWLRPRLPWLYGFHRKEGVFALIFSVLHPLMLLIGSGLDQFIGFFSVSNKFYIYIWMGLVQLLLLGVTGLTELFMKLPWLRTRWRTIHYLNYMVFVLVWLHSWNLGSYVRSTSLRFFWIFCLVSAAASTVGRITRAIIQFRRRTMSRV